MSSQVIDKLNKELAGDYQDIEFGIGDTVKVHVTIKEGEKTRVQLFPGTVIAMDGDSVTGTYTVRRISHGVGVERVFPLHSPHIEKVEIVNKTHVRRAKLYFLRDRVGKKARLREKIARR